MVQVLPGGRVASGFLVRVAGAVALLSLVGACAGPGQTVIGGTDSGVAPGSPIPIPVAAVSQASAGKSGEDRPAPTASPVATGYAAIARPSAPPSRLDGLRRGEVSDLLGEPSWIRRESRVEVWQYRSATCTLDLYLYLEAGGFRVAHAEARDGDARQVPVETCLGSIRADLAPTPAS